MNSIYEVNTGKQLATKGREESVRHAELFAGCGGLSLGLQAAGFETKFSNELSPMPSESYAYNLMGIDLRSPEFVQEDPSSRNVLWVASEFASHQITERIAENPFATLDDEHYFQDLAKVDTFEKKLLIGDLRLLNRWANTHGAFVDELDLVSGGPPCQSFSLAGQREFGNARNELPMEFARFVAQHKPKAVLLENVAGILRPFRNPSDGKLHHAWFEVAKAFARVGYIPLCMLVNAKDVGVAQNRPRYIMLALRTDIWKAFKRTDPKSATWFDRGVSLYNELTKVKDPVYDATQWKYFDLTGSDSESARLSFLKPLLSASHEITSVRAAIDDLSSGTLANESSYAKALSKEFDAILRQPSHLSRSKQEFRTPNHSARVKSRFRVYQVASELKQQGQLHASREIEDVIRGKLSRISDETFLLLQNEELLFDGVKRRPESSTQVTELLISLKTKKFSQRSLVADQPAPAALSIPDDVCHYRELRTLSVREMARIQSFPDLFQFQGVLTTGGHRRSYQVPQYTQVGNAVPPLLGKALGEVVKHVLDQSSKLQSGNTNDSVSASYHLSPNALAFAQQQVRVAIGTHSDQGVQTKSPDCFSPMHV